MPRMLSRRSFTKAALLSSIAPQMVSHANADNSAASDTRTIKNIAGSIQCSEIGSWNLERLNYILNEKITGFSNQKVQYPSAKYPVRLYKIEYPSVIPTHNNRSVRLSGLLAVPDIKIDTIPILSYQHGTVFTRDGVPSNPWNSIEAELIIALFASQGYAVIAADYIGKGSSSDLQDYLVKESQQQSTADLLSASENILNDLGYTPSHRFLAGWSQGGNVTMALLNKLEANDRPVRAAATVAAPTDLWIALATPLFNPGPKPPWLSLIYVLTAFSYEHYYSVPGLSQSFIRKEYYDAAKDFYLQKMFDLQKLSVPLAMLIEAQYFDPIFFYQSTFGKLLQKSVTYHVPFKTPMRNYYGETDEAVRSIFGQIPMNYQNALGSNKVEGISLGNYDHRGAFVRAAAEWKIWFDSLI